MKPTPLPPKVHARLRQRLSRQIPDPNHESQSDGIAHRASRPCPSIPAGLSCGAGPDDCLSRAGTEKGASEPPARWVALPVADPARPPANLALLHERFGGQTWGQEEVASFPGQPQTSPGQTKAARREVCGKIEQVDQLAAGKPGAGMQPGRGGKAPVASKQNLGKV